MTATEITAFIESDPLLAGLAMILFSILTFLIGRFVVGRGLMYIAKRTEAKWDDILVEHLKPYRVAWIAPLLVIYFFAHLAPDYQVLIERTALILIIWVTAITLNALLNALNTIYEASPSYSGVAIQGYLDLVKILIITIGLILSTSLVTGESPIVLLTGLGAATAVLLLVFRDTILSIVASVQIAANDLIKEGDWIEVPSYGADGDVLNISLHTVKIRNFDMTISVIPTYKMVDVAYKNWRGMQESGGRRIKRSLILDMLSIKFCDLEMLERVSKVDLIHDPIQEMIAELEAHRKNRSEPMDSALDGPQVTNVEIFRLYINHYLRSRDDIHQEGSMSLLIRALAPSDHGLPIEVYAFTKTTAWGEYEMIQAEIFDHLIAVADFFDLRVFQTPSGLDFAAWTSDR
ncbi:MAG TPA: mechanosensitive ion channel domain-containing protein [Anaerolineales bacterium]|nr:mechanosensitive ion channel domain-containing protein [Anaerolineales bacterium]